MTINKQINEAEFLKTQSLDLKNGCFKHKIYISTYCSYLI